MNRLQNGSILRGATGSGKSLVALAYYFVKVCEGQIYDEDGSFFSPMEKPLDLYIITTAHKRDKFEWDKELGPFLLSRFDENMSGNKVVIDSWNNIQKYVNTVGAFFIFDEQRVVGSGKWVRSFLQISKKNKWILLTATPGDTWLDYIPVFIANGFYKNRTEFKRRHVVYNMHSKFPKVERFIEVGRLIKLRDMITVNMDYVHPIEKHVEYREVDYNALLYSSVFKRRWNVYKDEPMQNAAELIYSLRRIVNSDTSRLEAALNVINEYGKVIIFYNFDYELELLRNLCKENNINFSEWNGHKHQPVPSKEGTWAYLVQYSAGSEGWNCIETNTILFYSLNYSYKTMTQAAGRIDRLNTPFSDLYYIYLKSNSKIDNMINSCLKKKKSFNEGQYVRFWPSQEKHALIWKERT